MWSTFIKLYRARLVTPLGVYRLLRALQDKGSNLMVLLDVTARIHGDAVALAEADRTTSYRQLYQEVRHLAYHLRHTYDLQPRQRVALSGRNHGDWVRALFACSYLGVDLYLLPSSLPTTLLVEHLERHCIDGLIHDLEDWEAVHRSGFEGWRLLFDHLTFPSVRSLSQTTPKVRFRLSRRSNGRLIVLTGGTTGAPQAASRKPSLRRFLSPFFALLRSLDLGTYRSTYLATPLYHGFGLSGLLVAVALGAKVVLTRRFELDIATKLLLRHQVQVWVVVPTQLRKLLTRSSIELIYTRLILSGGAALPPDLIQEAQTLSRVRIANLYGTSEVGFCFLAAPEDLERYPDSIGRPVKGAAVQLRDKQGQVLTTPNAVGELYVSANWSAQEQSSENWVATGDLAESNAIGYYFLRGRTSERIVSGGVNVFPQQVQDLIVSHPAVVECAVIGVKDELFGERLKAYVVVASYAQLSEADLRDWLVLHTTKAQRPREVVFVDMLPLTALGKVDKKALEDEA